MADQNESLRQRFLVSPRTRATEKPSLLGETVAAPGSAASAGAHIDRLLLYDGKADPEAIQASLVVAQQVYKAQAKPISSWQELVAEIQRYDSTGQLIIDSEGFPGGLQIHGEESSIDLADLLKLFQGKSRGSSKSWSSRAAIWVWSPTS
jgi:hypothetical protein